VTADHGQWAGNNSTEMERVYRNPPNPIMLVKYADSDMNRPLMISQAPVSHADLFATVIDGCGVDASAYGQTIREVPEDVSRERKYYFTAWMTVKKSPQW
jgi:arylsulfatase A-like enzyme